MREKERESSICNAVESGMKTNGQKNQVCSISGCLWASGAAFFFT